MAAARAARAHYLVSLDRKHLAGVEGLSKRSVVQIVLPADLLAVLRRGS